MRTVADRVVVGVRRHEVGAEGELEEHLGVEEGGLDVPADEGQVLDGDESVLELVCDRGGALVDQVGEEAAVVVRQDSRIGFVERLAEVAVVLDLAEVVVDGRDVLGEEVGHGRAEVLDGVARGAFVAAEVADVGQAGLAAPVDLGGDEVLEEELTAEGIEAQADVGGAGKVLDELREDGAERLAVAAFVLGLEYLGPGEARSVPDLEAFVVGIDGFDDVAEVRGEVLDVVGVGQGDEEIGRFAGEGVDVAVDEVRREAQGGRAPGDGGFIERRVGRRVVGGVGGGVGVGSGVGEEHLLLAQVGAELLHLHAGVAARVAVLVVEPDREAEALGAVAGVEDEFEPAFGEVGDPVAFAGVQDDAAASAGLHGLELLGDAGFLLDAVPEPEGVDAGLGGAGVCDGGHGGGREGSGFRKFET